MAELISATVGQKSDDKSQKVKWTQVSRVYDDITAVADDVRDLYLRA